MRICVIGPMSGPSASGEQPPSVFYLGARRLPVVAILRHWQDGSHHCYEVSVGDGRRFVLRREPVGGQWDLVAVYGAGPATARSPAAAPPTA